MNVSPGDGVAVSIVIPVFNERDNLPTLDAELRTMLAGLGRSAEIVYIDDASTDGSDATLDGLVAAHRGEAIATTVIHFRRNFGQTAALGAGIAAARGSVIVPMDGDLQNNPADVPRLLARIDQGFDVVSGWRKDRQDRADRRLPSRMANWLIGRLTGVRLHDHGCTLKAYRADLLKQVRLYGDMHRFIPVYLERLGARVTEEVVDHRARTRGVSKYGSKRIFKVFVDLFLLAFMSRYEARPMHFFGQAALLFLGLAGATGFSMVAFKLGWLRLLGIEYVADFIETPLPALGATFFLGAIMSLFFGILGELLTRVHHEVRGRHPYAVRSVATSEIASTVEAP